jgi:hypothetical protein
MIQSTMALSLVNYELTVWSPMVHPLCRGPNVLNRPISPLVTVENSIAALTVSRIMTQRNTVEQRRRRCGQCLEPLSPQERYCAAPLVR